MGLSLRALGKKIFDVAAGVERQINPFDNGATYSNPRPAPRPIAPQPSLVSRIGAQINPFDQGRSFGNPYGQANQGHFLTEFVKQLPSAADKVVSNISLGVYPALKDIPEIGRIGVARATNNDAAALAAAGRMRQNLNSIGNVGRGIARTAGEAELSAIELLTGKRLSVNPNTLPTPIRGVGRKILGNIPLQTTQEKTARTAKENPGLGGKLKAGAYAVGQTAQQAAVLYGLSHPQAVLGPGGETNPAFPKSSNIASGLDRVANNAEVIQARNTVGQLNLSREKLLASGLSENNPAVKANANAYKAAVQEYNRVVEKVASQQPSIGLATRSINDLGFTQRLKDYDIEQIRNTKDFDNAVNKIAVQDNISIDAAKVKAQQLLEQERIVTNRDFNYRVGLTPKPRVELAGNPVKDPRMKEILSKISNARTGANVEESLVANSVRQKAQELGVKVDRGFIDRYQAGKLTGEAEKQLGNFVKETTDKIFSTQKELTPDIVYRKNYVPQSYAQPEDVVRQATKTLQTRTGAAQPRQFNTYAEAGEYGLSPKYQTLDQMIGRNAAEAQRALGNRTAIDTGLKTGIFDTTGAKGWTPVEGFFDRTGNQIYAQKRVADIINGTLQETTSGVGKVARVGRKIASTQQDIALAGGYKQYNFFTFSQGVRDTARNVGTGLTGHPIEAVKQESHLIQDFFRSGSIDRTAKRFTDNADFIRDLANEGLPLTPQSSLTESSVWGKLFHNATFDRYLPNRMLSTAQEMYARSVGEVGHDAAIKLAAKNTKTLLGLTDEIAIGRSKLSSDIMGSTLFAPRYREGIINSLGHAIQSVVDPRTWAKNSGYRGSRELAAGMLATAVAYDALNKKLSGHHMWENRKGQELSLEIPTGGKDKKGRQPVINIPFMPGFATVPRAIFGMIQAATRGDITSSKPGEPSVLSEASKLASMPLQTAGRILANQDYFGNPIYTSPNVAKEQGVKSDKPAVALAKIGSYAFGQSIPSYGRGVQSVLQGKPAIQGIAQAAEAPVRFGNRPNPDTTAYFETRDSTYNKLNPNQKAVFDSLFPDKKNIFGDEIKETNPNDRITKASTLKGNPEVFKAVADMYKQLAQRTGQVIDPVYNLDWNKAQNVLWARSLAPGESSETKQELLYNQPWYPKFKAQETKFYNALEKKLGKKDDPYNYPKETAQINKLQETYFKLPKNTGQRTDFITAHPELTKYWDKHRDAVNRHRIALGLTPLKDEIAFKKNYSRSYRRGGGGGGRGSSNRMPAGSPYKYAISLNAGGAPAHPKVTARKAKLGKAKVASTSSNPKVSIKKSLV